MKLVPDWKEAWTWTSMHAFAGIGAVQGIWRALPDGIVAHLPSWTPLAATLLLVVLGIVGRVRDQGHEKKTCNFQNNSAVC